jgi:hypothetical protein
MSEVNMSEHRQTLTPDSLYRSHLSKSMWRNGQCVEAGANLDAHNGQRMEIRKRITSGKSERIENGT